MNFALGMIFEGDLKNHFKWKTLLLKRLIIALKETGK